METAEPGYDFTNVTVDLLKQIPVDVKQIVTSAIDSVVAVKEPRNFANTIRPLSVARHVVQPKKSLLSFVTNFYSAKELREVSVEMEKEIDKFSIESYLRKDLYLSILAYHTTTYPEEKKSLTAEEIRYVEQEMRDFRRSGLHLEDALYTEVKEKLKELTELCTQYNNQLNEEVTSFEFTRAALEGLPEHFFDDDRRVKDREEETYKVTLKYPDFLPVQDYARNEAVRKQTYFAYHSRCRDENTPLFARAIQLRYEVAKMLGYQFHADFKTEIAVIKTGKAALDFETGMNEKFTPLYERDMEKLFDFAKNKSKNPLPESKKELDAWDIRYYIRELTELECEINMEELRKYFPLPVVKKGLFEIYQKILGLRFIEIETTNKWHEEVQLYKVEDKESGEKLGYFYLDLHPRDGKYAHAAAFDFATSCELPDGTRRPHVLCIACNFPKDGCIEFEDVETFFHEFGHVMHQICSRPQFTRFAGFGIEWDFIEAPSQLLEYFCYARESLALMSQHTETGLPVPQNLIAKLRKKKNFMGGYFNKRIMLN